LYVKKWTNPDKKKGEHNVVFILQKILKNKKKLFRQKFFSILKWGIPSPFFLSGLVHFLTYNVFDIFILIFL
jgi:hypothetical protein